MGGRTERVPEAAEARLEILMRIDPRRRGRERATNSVEARNNRQALGLPSLAGAQEDLIILEGYATVGIALRPRARITSA